MAALRHQAAIVALRDENGAAVLAIDGTTVTDTKERIATGVNPYAVDAREAHPKLTGESRLFGEQRTPRRVRGACAVSSSAWGSESR